MSLLIDGTQAMLLDDLMKADEKLYKAYNLLPANPEVLFRLSQFENKRNNSEKSLDFAAKSWEYGWNLKAEYSLQYADLLTEAGRNKEALEVLKKGSSAHPDVQILTSKLALTYAQNGDSQKGLQVLQDFDKKRGSNQLTLITKAEILSLSKNAQANDAWEQAYLANHQKGDILLRWLKQLNPSQKEELKRPIQLLLTNTPSTHLYELFLEGIKLCKQSDMTEEAMQLILKGIQHPELSASQKQTLSGELVSLLSNEDLKSSAENLTILEQIIATQPESSSLLQSAAQMAFDFGDMVKSKQYYSDAQKRGVLTLANQLTFLKVLFYQNDWAAIENQAEQALMLFPQSMELSFWKGVSLLIQQKSAFRDWFDESYSFMINESDKANAEFLNKLYSNNFSMSANLPFISNQNIAMPVLWAVAYKGNYTAIGKITNIHEGLNQHYIILWNAFGMLKTEDYQKAVEMLKKHEQLTANNPLFCELYGFALIKTNQKETGEKWRSKAILLGLAKPVF